MGEAVGGVLILGVGVALSPLAVVAVTLLTSSPGTRSSAVAFLGGWALGLALVGTATLLLADGIDANRDGSPEDWVSALKLVAGLLLLYVAARQWRTEAKEEMPAWMRRVSVLPPARAAAVALPIAALKPKNLLLSIGAALSIAEVGADSAGQAVALLVFVVLGTLGPGAPVMIRLLAPARAPELLEKLRAVLVRENKTIIAVLCVLIACKFIGDAVASLTG